MTRDAKITIETLQKAKEALNNASITCTYPIDIDEDMKVFLNTCYLADITERCNKRLETKYD